jgi:hypothetical protein
VGAQQQVFSVHEGLLRASSSFFDKAMAGDWKESQKRTVHLPDDESAIFSLYVNWLYRGTLPVVSAEPGSPTDTEYTNLAKAYVLGDKILDPTFQDTVIDAILEKSQSKGKDGKCWYPHVEVIKYTFNNTNESAPIRKLFVDMYAGYARSSWIHKWAADLPQPFLFQLSCLLLDRRQGTTASFEPSRYHHSGRLPKGDTPQKTT